MLRFDQKNNLVIDYSKDKSLLRIVVFPLSILFGLTLTLYVFNKNGTLLRIIESIKYFDINKYSFYETSIHYVYGFRPNPKDSSWNIAADRKAIDDALAKGLWQNKEDYDFMNKALSIEKEASASIMVKEDFDKWLKQYFKIRQFFKSGS